ncbi:MAG TPA: PA2779 family protein [Burkholderiales bacterium]|nr:PA2779 family protein [Burkholderiales bacterium]
MNNTFVRFVSRMLVASLFCLPFHAQADLIATNRAISAEQAQSARATLAGHLEAFGIAPGEARDRVAALTDAEALSLADRAGQAPAGAGWNIGIGMLLVVAFLIWRFGFSDQAQAEQGKK